MESLTGKTVMVTGSAKAHRAGNRSALAREGARV
jgi:hypothetical protein